MKRIETGLIGEDEYELIQTVRAKLIIAATNMIEHNTPLIMRDLRKTAADEDDQRGEIPVSITFKMECLERKVWINPSIEWKRVKKSGDSLDLISIDPDQPELKM